MVVRVSGRNIAVRVVGGVGEMETGLMKVTVDKNRIKGLSGRTIRISFREEHTLNAQELVDALLNDCEGLNGQTVTAYGETYILKVSGFDDGEPDEYWDVSLEKTHDEEKDELQRELDKLTSDPIAVFVAEKRKELERKLYRLEHGKSSW